MANPALSPEQMQALDNTRQRLSQLNSSLQSLLTQVHNTDPLPSWSDLTSLATVISNNLATLATVQSKNTDLLSSLAAYPLPSYPGRAQEALLEQLLRKKLEPDLEERVVAGRARGLAAAGSVASQDVRTTARERWSWAGKAANECARKENWFGDYTSEEVEGGVEKVVTGLRRKLAVPGDEDEDDDDEDDEDEEAMEEGEGKDDGVEMVGIRRSSTAGQVEFDVHGNGEGKLDAKPAMPMKPQLQYMMTGK